MSHEKPDWLTPETLAYLRDVEYRFHVRAFGEEMARLTSCRWIKESSTCTRSSTTPAAKGSSPTNRHEA